MGYAAFLFDGGEWDLGGLHPLANEEDFTLNFDFANTQDAVILACASGN